VRIPAAILLQYNILDSFSHQPLLLHRDLGLVVPVNFDHLGSGPTKAGTLSC
jgi:hypothetical protein